MEVTEKGRRKYGETRRIIQKAKTEKQLVLFVGAGTSHDSGIPLWSEAVKEISQKLYGDDKETNIDNSELLKIPQYYYDLRGKKEYTQLMREIFRYGEKLDTKVIHQKLLKFETEVIITTNYDHLIEQVAENNGEFLQVISQNSDLVYQNGQKMLVKMHGDLEHDNFVLKEEDYLNYQRNFGLIENYVKSLIGTKLILFIGYSLSDPDIKQIIAWMKDILRDNYQRAYLVYTGKQKNDFNEAYLKNLGVNVINAVELLGRDYGHTQNLIGVIDYLLEDPRKELSTDRFLYEELKPFTKMNYVYGSYIEDAFSKAFRTVYSDSCHTLIQSARANEESENSILREICRSDDHPEEIKKEQEKEKTVILNSIAEVLQKSRFREIVIQKKKPNEDEERFEIPEKYHSEWAEELLSFNYKEIKTKVERNSKVLLDAEPERYLQQGYLAAILGDYETAYSCYHNVANIYYRRKEYTWYFISLRNKKLIAPLLYNGFWNGLPGNKRAELFEEAKNINLTKTLLSIPDQGNSGNQYLQDLIDFGLAKNLFYEIYRESLEDEKQGKTDYFLFCGNSAIEKLQVLTADYCLYCLQNYIYEGHYKEVESPLHLYSRSLISSLATPDRNGDLMGGVGTSSNIHAEHLTKMDAYILLQYNSMEQLDDIFKTNNIEELPDSTSIDILPFLETVAENLFDAYDLNVKPAKEIFERLLILLSHIRINSKIAETVLRTFKKTNSNERHSLLRKHAPMLIRALIRQKQYDDGILSLAQELLGNELETIQDNIDDLHLVRGYILNLADLCYSGGKPYNNRAHIQGLKKPVYLMLLLQMYNILGVDAQESVREMADDWKFENTYNDRIIYAELLLHKIRIPNDVIEKNAITKMMDGFRENKNGVVKRISSNEDLYSFSELHLHDMIVDRTAFRNLVLESGDQFCNWLVSMDTYDYTQFDLSYLEQCYPSLLREIAANESVRRAIVKRFRQQYGENDVSPKVINNIINYFLSDEENEEIISNEMGLSDN